MIEIKDLNKSFEDLAALKNVNIKIQKGSVYGLVGSNGAGKTTLLKTMVGVYQGDQGTCYIDGQEVFENVAIKAKVIFIPDTLYFFPNYSVRDMAKYYKNIYPAWNEVRFEKLKEAFDIDVNKNINRLSKGMQRQVAFWLALSSMPDYLILDEPLDGLDPVMRQKVKNLLIQDVAERQMTVLISSHNLRELEDLCDTIGILHKGTLILEKELDDLKSDVHKIQVAFKEEVSGEFLANAQAQVLYEEIRGSVRLFIMRGNKDDLTRIFAKQQPLVLDILPLTLEEVFIYEMGGIGYAIENIII
ncbi:ABC transporter ATP-binding protein [Desulforamulus aeronauticus]|uniref:ABC-2 type transport system ATP-binding protein n=1 Tax=Desulforamulus aeronauticus DSM 10349 TaxID=1121421 RepID=A0A1M6SYQ0_9FIRM|nr:ABC transporter ATP-binding protein [Desulforamulus aeronauticus]SHK49845.1 ABC-2 type transport system ATP-binding protein [Desulforamulus aeronauticus DSM 10349]